MAATIVDTPIPPSSKNSDPAGTGPAPTVRIGGSAFTFPPPTQPSSHLPTVPGYEMLGVVGSGGMGMVYKARHRELNRVVALKMLHRDAAFDRDSQERFRVEAEAVARLQHPNIIQVFAVGTADAQPSAGQPFMSLEFVDGGSLSRRTLTPQSPKYAAPLVEKLARAVHAAHEVGVIHRDLKPANVLMTAGGEPKIADFGLAKQLEPPSDDSGRYKTQVGTVLGTPEYMAPEQVEGRPPAPAMDVYALGVILYELLTGRVPFKGATLTETLVMVARAEPVSPRRLQPKLPLDLETICLKCLSKEPGKRYGTAAELADDLARWNAGKSIRARPVGRAARVVRWSRRNPAVAGLTALSAVLLLVGVSVVLWKWQEARTNEATANRIADEERWERYKADIRAAASALQLNHVSVARKALENAPEKHRGWEWAVLDAQLDTSSRTVRVADFDGAPIVANGARTVAFNGFFPGRTARVYDLPAGTEATPIRDLRAYYNWDVSPDGRLAAATRPDHTILIRTLVGDRPVCELKGHRDRVHSCHFAARGKRVATASEDGTVRVWDAETGKPLAVRAFDWPAMLNDISADGRRVTFSPKTRQSIHLWDVDADAVRELATDGPFVGGRFSPSGERYVASEPYPKCGVRLWNTVSGKPVGNLTGHTNQIHQMVFDASGKRFATCSMDHSVRVWNATDGKPVATLMGHVGWVNQVAFSPDGSLLASGGLDKTVRLWDVGGTAEPVAVMHGHEGEVIEVAFSPDGGTVHTAARDGTLRTWDVATALRRGPIRGHGDFVYAVAFHPDGRRVLSGSWDGTARVWDTTTGKEVCRLDHGKENYVTSVAVHPNGKVAATASRMNSVRLWDIDTGKPLHEWEVPTHDWRTTRLAISPTGDLLACGGKDCGVHLFDLRTHAKVGVLKGHTDVVRDVAFSPDGKTLASVADSHDKTVRLWDLATLTETAALRGHNARVYAVTFSPDGKTVASGAWDGTVRLWDVAGKEELAELKHGANVYAVAFTPDGKRLASGCADTSIRLWDVASRQEVAELRRHTEYVHSLAFSPDGKRLVSGSGDKTLRVWDTVRVSEAK